MWDSIQRLWLGLILICCCSAILLISDTPRPKLGSVNAPGASVVSDRIVRVAMFQLASNPIIDEGAAGVLLSLKEAGYVDRLVMNTKWQFYAYVVYCVVCWHFWSATPGKLICRLQVVDAKTGGRIGTMQSILRAMFYLPSALFFGLGFFWIAFNKKRRGWHDYFAGTEVIIKQAAIKEP